MNAGQASSIIVRWAMRAGVAAVCVFASALHAQKLPGSPTDLGELRAALQRGGYVMYLRHAQTDPDTDDVEPVDLQKCAGQRNLSAEGQDQARQIGRGIAALGIKVSQVFSSPYCRCRDTARLAFGQVTLVNDLQSALLKPQAQVRHLGAALRRLLQTVPPNGTNSVIVGHPSNLKEAVGIWPQPHGAIYVFQPLGDDARFVGRITAEDWQRLARRP